MPIQMQCPQCQAKAALPDNHAGRPVRCKHCKATFTIPKDAGAHPDQPAVIDRYLVRELLGEGAFGCVYRAFDPRLERDVALKVLRPQMMSSAQAVERFLREAKSAAKLLHPNIVPVYDAGRSGSLYYIASAYIQGKTLASAAPEEGGMEPSRAVRLTAQLATALGYAHQQGILHRDVKPANAMVNEQESLHLMDFGLAGWTQEESTRLTRLGAVMGTPAYMAPEQALGDTKNVGPAADLYSAGAVLYELLTSRLPFNAGNAVGLTYQIVHAPPTPPSQHKPGVDARLEAICLKALAKKPEERFASGEAMAAALFDWAPAAVPIAQPVGTAGRPIDRTKATVAPLTSASPKQTIIPASGKAAVRRPSVFDRETVMPAAAKRSTLESPPAARTQGGSRRRPPIPQNQVLVGVLLAAVVGVLLLGMLIWLNSPKPQKTALVDGGEKEPMVPRVVSLPEVATKTDASTEPTPKGPPPQKIDGPPQERFAEGIINGVGMKFRWIKPGGFLMGSPDGTTPPGVPAEKYRRANDTPSHPVTLTRGYYMGVYPVTKSQFGAFVQASGYQTEAEKARATVTWRNTDFPTGYNQSDNDPVIAVTYDDAVKFCEWLSKKEGRTYQLPTEAQFEYACRAGTTTAYFFGENLRGLGDYSWYRSNAGGHTHPVGEKKPNPWGLYDMNGNVFQWCRDEYAENPTNDGVDAINTSKGFEGARVCRGASWVHYSQICRAANRSPLAHNTVFNDVGFRVVMRPD